MQQKLPGGAGFVGCIVQEILLPVVCLVLQGVRERLRAAVALGGLNERPHHRLGKLSIVVISRRAEVGDAVPEWKLVGATLAGQRRRRRGQVAETQRAHKVVGSHHEAKLTRVSPRLVKKIRYTAPK